MKINVGKANLKGMSVGLKKFLATYRIAVFIFLAVLAFAYVAGLFYLYAWRVSAPGPDESKKISIDASLYEKVTAAMKQKEINFAAEDSKVYTDPFR
ncbi:MAG: hypothetical protein V1845_03690 [bacterium]